MIFDFVRREHSTSSELIAGIDLHISYSEFDFELLGIPFVNRGVIIGGKIPYR